MKVTATKCLKGKLHRWKSLVTIPGKQYDPVSYEHKVCKVCGCTTEFFCDANKRYPFRKTWKRCRNDDGTFEVRIPDCHKTQVEIREERLAKARYERTLIGECEESPG